jgi:hypothetical protein
MFRLTGAAVGLAIVLLAPGCSSSSDETVAEASSTPSTEATSPSSSPSSSTRMTKEEAAAFYQQTAAEADQKARELLSLMASGRTKEGCAAMVEWHNANSAAVTSVLWPEWVQPLIDKREEIAVALNADVYGPCAAAADDEAARAVFSEASNGDLQVKHYSLTKSIERSLGIPATP